MAYQESYALSPRLREEQFNFYDINGVTTIWEEKGACVLKIIHHYHMQDGRSMISLGHTLLV